MLKRIGQFIFEMCKTWGALLTGGFIIAIIASWQFTGHGIPPKVGWSLIIGAIIVAAFQVWDRQVTLKQETQRDIEEEKRKRGSPLVLLNVTPIQNFGEGGLRFALTNQGLLDAFNVQIQSIVLPKSTATFPQIRKLFVGESVTLKPDIKPIKESHHRHDFSRMLHEQPEPFLLRLRTPECEGKIDPIIAIPVDITYGNSTGREWFTTKMQIIYDFSEANDYYVDTKLIETTPIPEPI